MELLWCLIFTCVYCAIGFGFVVLMNANDDDLGFVLAFWPMILFLMIMFVLFIYLPVMLFEWVRNRRW